MESTSLTPEDINTLVMAGATDPLLFAKAFFPKTVRQASPPFHRDAISDILLSQDRYVMIEFFRGAAKTTLSRLALAFRVSYGLTNTNLIIGKSEGHAFYTSQWLKRQVETNALWREVFGLTIGEKWSDEMFCIRNTLIGRDIWFLAMGLFGSNRGVNLDDYRPDFILCDDLQDDQNSQTAEQRAKVDDIVHGALRNSLAPSTENPHAKFVLLGTPFHKEDVLQNCKKSKLFHCRTISVFDENGESVWPERYPTATLLAEKEEYIQRNKLSVWLREMEAILANPEHAIFKADSLQSYIIEPLEGSIYIGIDPTPIPKEIVQKRDPRLDSFVIRAILLNQSGCYLLDVRSYTAPPKIEWLTGLFELIMKYRSRLEWIAVETFGFQRYVGQAIREEMIRKNIFVPVREVEDKLPKLVRIEQQLSRFASHRRLFVRLRGDEAFIEQFTTVSALKPIAHEDELDAVATALATVPFMLKDETGSSPAASQGEREPTPREIRNSRGAP